MASFADPLVRSYRCDELRLAPLLAAIRGRPIQLMRADRIYGADHLRHAARLASRALAEGRARSADLATETLLYAAGERQVHKAIAFLGLADGARAIAAVAWDARRVDRDAAATLAGAAGASALDALAREQGWTRDDALLEGDASVLDAFGVTAEERAMFPPARWGELVLERVALVDVLKA